MSDVLFPIGLGAFIVLFAFAMVSAGRKQRAQKSGAFRDFAQRHGLHYRATDDGTAQRFAADLDGIGQFKSSSLGDVIPQDVATGTIDGLNVILFRHHTRFYEGYAQEWFVAGIQAEADIAVRCAVQLFRGRVETDSMYLIDEVVERRHIEPFDVLVRAPDLAAAGSVLEDEALSELARLARGLPFRPEIQIRSNRIAVYPGHRNESIDNVDDLRQLVDFAKGAAAILS